MTTASHKPGAFVSFKFDRTLVEQFRQAFPKARWNDEEGRWYVPGKTAERRFARWIGRRLADDDPFADERGRDAFAFDPISSPYLTTADDIRVHTPFSHRIVRELRQVPWARWDDELRLWRVPFRSFEEFKRRWPTIEAEARRNEPEERKSRRLALRGSPEEQEKRKRRAERQRRRFPVPRVFPPELGRPIATDAYGIVVFAEVTPDRVAPDFGRLYPHMQNSLMEFVWATWRSPTFAELVAAWPARSPVDDRRGWWLPTLEELRIARKKARSRERRRVVTTDNRPREE